MPEFDYSLAYNTALSPQEEQLFRGWLAMNSVILRRDLSRDLFDYDLRGYFKKNGMAPLTGAHLTDEFKKPNHMTFSAESKYQGTPLPTGQKAEGGQWGERTFQPANTVLHDLSELQQYFGEAEPGYKVLPPKDGK